MTTPADDDFLAELQRRVLTDAERNDDLQAVAFTDYMRSVLTDTGDLDDGETALFQTEGPKPMGASGFAISEDGEVVDVLVTEYEPTASVRTLTKPQVARQFAAVSRFLEQVESLVEVLEESFPAWGMCRSLSEALPGAARIRLTLLTNARVKAAPPEPIDLVGARVTHHVWDLDRLCRLEKSGRIANPSPSTSPSWAAALFQCSGRRAFLATTRPTCC